MPSRSYGSFVFKLGRNALEEQINDDVRRSYSSMRFWDCLELRRPMIEEIDKQELEYDPLQSIAFLKVILKKNGIKFDKFVESVIDWINMKHQKKNCLYFFGPSNAMKSTIANSLKNAVPAVGQQVTSSDFAFGNCINCNIVYGEETRVTLDVVCETKRMWEGADVMLNVKCKQGQMWTRKPILCCSNYTPWEFVPNEKQTLLNRSYYYEFKVFKEFEKITKGFSPLMWKVLAGGEAVKTIEQTISIDNNNLFF